MYCYHHHVCQTFQIIRYCKLLVLFLYYEAAQLAQAILLKLTLSMLGTPQQK